MNKHSRTAHNDVSDLADDARALVTATAHVAGEKVAEARERLTSALESARDSAVDGAKAADKMVRNKPYQAIGVAFVAGALLVYLMGRRK